MLNDNVNTFKIGVTSLNHQSPMVIDIDIDIDIDLMTTILFLEK